MPSATTHGSRHVAAIIPRQIAWARTLLFVLAGIDALALLLFVARYHLQHDAFTRWVTGTSLYTGLIKQHGLRWTEHYALFSTAAVHLVITGLFLWLARSVPTGKPSRRIRATAVLIISAAINGFAALAPAAGAAQQTVMAMSLVIKLMALWLLWANRPARAFFARSVE